MLTLRASLAVPFLAVACRSVSGTPQAAAAAAAVAGTHRLELTRGVVRAAVD
jgi:hypothetical protein